MNSLINNTITYLTLLLFSFSTSGESIVYSSSEPEIKLYLEGWYEKRDIPLQRKYPNKTECVTQQTLHTFRAFGKTLHGSSSLSLGDKVVSQNKKQIPFFLIPKCTIYDEFASLLGKRVHIEGTLEQSDDVFFFTIPQINLDYIVESKWTQNLCETLPYEPQEITLTGKLYEMIYERPEEENSFEKVLILALNEPIHIESCSDDDPFNLPEKYVLEIALLPPDDANISSMIHKKVKVKGTLFHAHTHHHHRRILCDVKSIRDYF